MTTATLPETAAPTEVEFNTETATLVHDLEGFPDTGFYIHEILYRTENGQCFIEERRWDGCESEQGEPTSRTLEGIDTCRAIGLLYELQAVGAIVRHFTPEERAAYDARQKRGCEPVQISLTVKRSALELFEKFAAKRGMDLITYLNCAAWEFAPDPRESKA